MTDQPAEPAGADGRKPGPRQQVSRPAPPARPDDGHKGRFGRVLVIAGSRGMSGAAALCGYGALRGGAGLVWLAIPDSISSIVATIEPSWLTIPLPEDSDGRLCSASRDELRSAVENRDVVAAGPGWGQTEELRELAHWLYQSVSCPLVIDADFLNLLAGADDVLGSPGGPRILTPHPGEFARLLDCSIAEVEAARESLSCQFTDRYPVTLLLKGPATLVTDQHSQYVNDTGNSGMGTGGCGDVLTGLIAALIGQQMTPFEAAAFGSWLHGTAGDLAAASLSRQAMLASDLARFLPAAWLSACG